MNLNNNDEIQVDTDDSPRTSVGTIGAVAPTALRSDGKAVLNERIQVYMNIGAWTGGQSTFGLVSGRHVALCSWMRQPTAGGCAGKGIFKSADREAEALKEPGGGSEPNLIRTFLQGLRTADGVIYKDRGFVIYYHRSRLLDAFVDGKTLFVFLPDMHINLFRMLAINAFAPGGKWATELNSLLNYVRRFSKKNGATRVRVVHLGDLYELFHVQGLLDACFRQEIRELRKESDVRAISADSVKDSDYDDDGRPKKLFTRHMDKRAYHAGKVTEFLRKYEDKRKKYRDGEGIKIDEALKILSRIDGLRWDEKHRRKDIAQLQCVRRGTKIAVSNLDKIEKAIQEEYPELKDNWDILTGTCVDDNLTSEYLRGNHDLREANRYVDGVYNKKQFVEYAERQCMKPNRKGQMSTSEWKKPWGPTKSEWARMDDELIDEPSPEETKPGTHDWRRYASRSGHMWYEHGHAWDPFNNKLVSDRFDTHGRKSAELGKKLPGGWKVVQDYIIRVLNVDAGPSNVPLVMLLFPPFTILGIVGQLALEGEHAKDEGMKKLETWIGDKQLETYSGWRMKGIFHERGKRNGTVMPIRLVVMGHTHVPYMAVGEFAFPSSQSVRDTTERLPKAWKKGRSAGIEQASSEQLE